MISRPIIQRIQAQAASDGAGVKLYRSLGATPSLRLDPFLMLDEFGSDNPDEYLAGFPAHPHRGFETVTYMIDGHMLHEDHLGNRGDLTAGGVQWMTAGRGIIHSEMPQQLEGRMRGFQLWINLPAREKMKPAGYRDISVAEIPELALDGGGSVKIIAGSYAAENCQVIGPMIGLSTEFVYLDVLLPAKATFRYPLPPGHNALVYAYEGGLRIGEAGEALPSRVACILGPGDGVEVLAEQASRFIVLAGKPIREPIAQYGPFVMNTRQEIEQAVSDYQSGRLTAA